MEKILVVDDEEEAADALKAFLTARGYQVYTAGDGLKAIAVVRDTKPQVVLLDIVMPGKGGIDTLKEIRRIDRNIKVIMVTAVADEEIAKLAIELGAADYMTKPVDFDYLKAAVLKKILPEAKPSGEPLEKEKKTILLRALSGEAEGALQGKEIKIAKLPFYIGRKSFRSLDLSLIDHEPFQISRIHCFLSCKDDKFCITDAGSTLGMAVDGVRIGKHGSSNCALLKPGVHKMTLGSARSPYHFELEILMEL